MIMLQYCEVLMKPTSPTWLPIRPAGFEWIMQTHSPGTLTHSLIHCFSHFKFRHILSTRNSCPCTLSPFCQGFYILSNHNRKPHTSNSIIGWSTGESTGVPQKVQIGQTTLADGLFTEARSPLLCAAENAGSCPVCFYAQKFNWTQNSTSTETMPPSPII